MQATESEQQLIDRARGIHERVITLDTHVDIDTDNFTTDNNYTADLDTQVTLPKMESGGLDVAWFIVYTGQGPLDDAGNPDFEHIETIDLHLLNQHLQALADGDPVIVPEFDFKVGKKTFDEKNKLTVHAHQIIIMDKM